MPGADRTVTRLPHLIYGGDYTPEQWPEEVWHEDVRLMQEARVNLVSLGIFAWARLEPAPGRFDFEWLDRIMEELHAGGIAVDLATPTASPPAWLVRQHPEMLPRAVDGTVLWHGSRHHYCPHSIAYRERAAIVARALAEHYRDHPAVVLWHVDNEYACHVGECFCDASVAAFREWLRGRHGDLASLNDAWGTAFWGQQYGDWQEVDAPRRMPAFRNPGQQSDWRRFCSDSWQDCYRDQLAILREVTPGVPVTTNFMGFFGPIDYWEFATLEDVVSNDCYPETSDPDWMIESGMACDLVRSLGGGRPWMLMEQAAGHVQWRPRNSTKAPGVMRLGSFQAVARGADAVMFFQWRASRAGGEQYHSAMVPHAGPVGRTWQEVTDLGRELAQLDDLVGSRVPAEVAILFDWRSWWALQGDGKPSTDLDLLPLVRDWYAAAFRRNLTVDFAHPGADLSRYRLIVAPMLYLVDDAAAANIVDWVADGGTLVMSYFSGIVDERSHVRLGGYPAPFREMLGLVVREFAPRALGPDGTVQTPDGRTFPSRSWVDIIDLEGAEALATHADGWFAGSAAVTTHAHAAGTGLYVGSRLDPEGTDWVLARALEGSGIRPVVPAAEGIPGVEVVLRSDGATDWWFVLNHGLEERHVSLPVRGRDVLGGAAVDGTVRVGGLDVALVRAETAGA